MTGTDGMIETSFRAKNPLASRPPIIARNPEANRPNGSAPQLQSAGVRSGLRPCSTCLGHLRVGCDRCFDPADQSQPAYGDGAQPQTTILSPAPTTHEAPVPGSDRGWRGGGRKLSGYPAEGEVYGNKNSHNGGSLRNPRGSEIVRPSSLGLNRRLLHRATTFRNPARRRTRRE